MTPDPITVLTRKLDLATYRAVLAHPWWSLIRQAIIDTRSYDRGLDAGLRLLSHTDTYRGDLAPRELEAHVTTLSLFVLEMLVKGGPKLDQSGGGKLDHPAARWRV